MVYLENNQSKISAEWSEILPPAQLKNVGATLQPETFTDFLLARPTEDYIDCFNKSSFYDQNTTRYFNLSINEIASDIPRELNFLADLYSSWNNENLIAAQFNEAEQKLAQFPGKQLPENLGDFQNIAESLGNTGLEKDLDGSGNLSLSSILNCFMIIYKKLQDGLLFSKK